LRRLGWSRLERLALFRDLRGALAARLGLPDFSMGMSGDWPEAVAARETTGCELLGAVRVHARSERPESEPDSDLSGPIQANPCSETMFDV